VKEAAVDHHDGGSLTGRYDIRPIRRETATTIAECEALILTAAAPPDVRSPRARLSV